MTPLIVELLSLTGSLASLISLFVSIRPANSPYEFRETLLVSVSLVLGLFLAYMRVRSYLASRPICLEPGREIRDYMYNWISKGSQVMIFSRDLTWANDHEMRTLLKKKAKRGELSICLRAHISLSDELRIAGATIFTYGGLDFTPSARFTIINHGRSDAHLAIGRVSEGKHIVREIVSGQDPLFALASDLADIVMKVNQKRDESKEQA